METEDVTATWRVPGAARMPLSCLPLWRLRRVQAFVDSRLDAPLRLTDLASAAGLSRMHFAARFRAATGMRPHDYVLARRIDFAKQRMIAGQDTLVQVALDAGFQSQAHFCTVFKRLNGVTPTAWQRQALAALAVQWTEPALRFPLRSLATDFPGLAHRTHSMPFSTGAHLA